MLSVEPKSSSVATRQVFGLQQRFPYSSCYCEENVYLLASDLVRLGYAASIDELFAVFIINPSKKIPMWKQRAGLSQRLHRRRRKQQQQQRQHKEGHGDDGADDSGEDYSNSGGDSDRESGSGSSSSSSHHDSEGDKEADEDFNSDDVEGLVVWDYHVVLVQVPSCQQTSRTQQAAAVAPDPGLAMGVGPAGATPTTPAVAAGGQANTRVPPDVALQTAFAAVNVAAPTVASPVGEVLTGSRCSGGVAAVERPISATGASSPAARFGALVWDLDTLLPFPCSLELYAQRALKYQRFFRVVPASAYLYHFASDRSHMRLEGGDWRVRPPPYPPIIAADGATNNIQCYWDMMKRTSEGEGEGETKSGEVEILQDVIRTLQQGPAGHSGSDGRADAESHNSMVHGVGRKSAQPYGIVLDERSFLRAFGVLSEGSGEAGSP